MRYITTQVAVLLTTTATFRSTLDGRIHTDSMSCSAPGPRQADTGDTVADLSILSRSLDLTISLSPRNWVLALPEWHRDMEIQITGGPGGKPFYLASLRHMYIYIYIWVFYEQGDWRWNGQTTCLPVWSTRSRGIGEKGELGRSPASAYDE
ncbi:hypothetical protein PV11_00286 [Exophiala sideris]|uniref:Uncharacterized protein n=1 Tax=Exophiala sideris TaxID=1016849 RepID=A0A0D1X9M8_9EURO|nr:hypothetical protein PV11_00286 [Exophiala sideris]